MITLADLHRAKAAGRRITYNSEWWRIVGVEPCHGLCSQFRHGNGCAGIVHLIKADDPGWCWDSLHVDADRGLPDG